MTVDFDTDIGSSTATSYVTIQEMEQYFFNKGYDFDSLNENDKIRLVNSSTHYIDSNYQSSFPGYQQTSEQSLLWPRNSAYYISGYEIDEDVIPNEVKNAVCEMSQLINTGTVPFATISKSGKILKESSQVDVIKESLSYSDGTQLYQDVYTIIDAALAKITGGVSDNFTLKVIRAGGESA